MVLFFSATQVLSRSAATAASVKRKVKTKNKTENNTESVASSSSTSKSVKKVPVVNGTKRESVPVETPVRMARPKQSDISMSMRENLRRLKNVLKLPKARRWVYCEFFYSGVDQQLFMGDNEFLHMLRDALPNLRTYKLCRPEWRAVRRMIGKPRRCSEAFLTEEREVLQAKSGLDLPVRLPRPLVVGAKIYARVRSPKDGIYAGTIDAILPDSYRVVFDKEEMIPPMIIKDSEVMSYQPVELLSVHYYLEQNRAAIPNSLMRFGHIGFQHKINDSTTSRIYATPDSTRKTAGMRDEKVGNFPVRMLVILVKLNKLLDVKRMYVRQLTDLNAEAERMNLLTEAYPTVFQVLLTARPEVLRKTCYTHAVQIVKHCNNGLNVQNTRVLDLATSLTALLLQVRINRSDCIKVQLLSNIS
ncbi:unnamed protein product [Gongylonema pulchrum]|uniref:DIRP domain-containing protein n=1 Tax=Gongylonema pulchrum TaxID=637853 RepID=A0A3P7M2I4_9BILA|nr:unnamed protein product [Gongylonema pulchrum]